MRWRKRYSRYVKRFALLPIKALVPDVYEQEYRWLETVFLYQSRDYLFGIMPYWHTIKFVKKDDYDAYRSRIAKEKEDV